MVAAPTTVGRVGLSSPARPPSQDSGSAGWYRAAKVLLDRRKEKLILWGAYHDHALFFHPQ